MCIWKLASLFTLTSIIASIPTFSTTLTYGGVIIITSDSPPPPLMDYPPPLMESALKIAHSIIFHSFCL